LCLLAGSSRNSFWSFCRHFFLFFVVNAVSLSCWHNPPCWGLDWWLSQLF